MVWRATRIHMVWFGGLHVYIWFGGLHRLVGGARADVAAEDPSQERRAGRCTSLALPALACATLCVRPGRPVQRFRGGLDCPAGVARAFHLVFFFFTPVTGPRRSLSLKPSRLTSPCPASLTPAMSPSHRKLLRMASRALGRCLPQRPAQLLHQPVYGLWFMVYGLWFKVDVNRSCGC